MGNIGGFIVRLLLLIAFVNIGIIIRLGLFSNIGKRLLKIVIIVTNIVAVLFFTVYSIIK